MPVMPYEKETAPVYGGSITLTLDVPETVDVRAFGEQLQAAFDDVMHGRYNPATTRLADARQIALDAIEIVRTLIEETDGFKMPDDRWQDLFRAAFQARFGPLNWS